jgi:hypothetical protein
MRHGLYVWDILLEYYSLRPLDFWHSSRFNKGSCLLSDQLLLQDLADAWSLCGVFNKELVNQVLKCGAVVAWDPCRLLLDNFEDQTQQVVGFERVL